MDDLPAFRPRAVTDHYFVAGPVVLGLSGERPMVKVVFLQVGNGDARAVYLDVDEAERLSMMLDDRVKLLKPETAGE